MKQQIIEMIAFPIALVLFPVVFGFIGIKIGRAVAWVIGSILIWQYRRKSTRKETP